MIRSETAATTTNEPIQMNRIRVISEIGEQLDIPLTPPPTQTRPDEKRKSISFGLQPQPPQRPVNMQTDFLTVVTSLQAPSMSSMSSSVGLTPSPLNSTLPIIQTKIEELNELVYFCKIFSGRNFQVINEI